MEATICNGSKSVLLQLIQMHCAWHLQVRDEKKNQQLPPKNLYSGQAESVLQVRYSMQDLWETNCSCILQRFQFKPFLFESSLKAVLFRVSLLVFDSTLKRVLETLFSPHTAGMNIDGLYNQNDVESLQQFR